MAYYTALLQEHKEKARAGLDYYRKLTESTYRHICMLQQQKLITDKAAELSAILSADYMMGKNLPHCPACEDILQDEAGLK